MISAEPVLVLGGTGKTGRRLAERLAAFGKPVRIGSRSGQPAFDWNDQNTWKAALDGAGAAYISYYPDLAVPGAADTVGAFARLAVRTGVKRLVLLSGRGEPEAQRAEQAVQDSGADWTILRSAFFCQNFSESFMLEAIDAGVVALPVGDVKEPFIDADDIADAATAALTQEGHVGQLYELTGPRLLSFAEAIGEIGRSSGREIRYVQITPREFDAMLIEQHLPAEFVGLLNELFTQVLDGRNSYLTDGMHRALGRAPRDFRDYAKATAATCVWNPRIG